MKILSRLPWQYSGVVSILWADCPRKVQSIWRHDRRHSYHLVRLKIGKLSILRLRQTADHARRLGLPIV
jgi:hypothetical protein